MAQMFQPVRGTEKAIKNITPKDNYVYFAYDTGNIYVDKSGARYLMGGNSTGIIYADGGAEDIINIEDSNNEPTSYYKINFTALEDPTTVPKPDCLVLNSDGRFFRVISIEDNSMTTLLLAISGTGSGNGGGTNVGPGIVEDLSIVPNTATIGGSFVYVYNQHYEAEVTVNCTSGDTEVDLIVEFFANNNINSEPIWTIPKRGQPIGKPIKIDMGEVDYIGNNVAVRLTATAANSKMPDGVSRRFNNLRFVDMHIEKYGDQNFIPIQQNSNLTLSFIPFGKGLPVQLHMSVDGEELTNQIKNLIDDNMGARNTVSIPKQETGTHNINLWLTTNVNNTDLLSTPISFEASWSNENNEIPLIWLGEINPVVVKYENAIIPYMVFDPKAENAQSNTVVDFYYNKKLINSEEVKYSNNNWLYWDVTALYTEGQNNFMIRCGSTGKNISFNVTTEGSRDLSLVNSDNLIMDFDSLGRSNTEIKSNRITWKSNVKDYLAILNNFNWYNNGWLNNDDSFGSYLSIANGASVEIPFGNIVLGSAASSWTFEMRFRIRNAQKYATLVTEIPKYVYLDAQGRENIPGEEKTMEQIEALGGTPKLDEDGNYIMNEANTTEKIVETNKNIALKYLNGDNFGFCIGTQEAYFTTPGKTVNVRYKENEIINISFVIDKKKNSLSIYLNGILSGAADLNNINSFTMENISFLMNSQYCDFDLFKFRIYNIALTMPEIIHNYLADIKSIVLYDQNQLTDINDATKLSYAKLLEYNENHPEALSMPYAVIDSSGTPNDDELPHFKGGNKKVAITFVNPVADKLLEDGLITEYQYYTHCPSFTSDRIDINVQGTSSQKYPRRNFKTKFKKDKNDSRASEHFWKYSKGSLAGKAVDKEYTLEDGNVIKKNWHMDNEQLSTNKFTWKIDYMESSGSYNTGLANLMGNNVYSKHPLEDLDLGIDTSYYRTSVYGFPMLVFHKRADGTYTYIGRYNLNLDKSSNEYYGFEEKIEQPYVNQEWDEYEDDGETIKQHHMHPLIKDIAECWELRDNQGTWCSFRYPTDEARQAGFGAQTSDATVENPKLEVAKHFEARYHVFADQIEAAQSYNPRPDGNDYTDIIGNNNSAICTWLRGKMSNLEALFNWLDSTDTSKVKVGEEVDLPASVELEVSQMVDDPSVTYETRTINGTEKIFGTFTKDTVEYRRQKFRSEFELHLDKHYCTIYFIITELLLCYDSRGKNMMMATFGPTKNSQGNYVWYPIFYDIDTQLGLNNVGALLWDYNEDATENRTFSTGNSVLWDNFADVFKEDIKSTYQELRKTKITYQRIEGAYICDPNVFTSSYAMRGIRPIVAIGLDEYYKYVLPVTERWKMQDGSYGTANYLYACQGDRILSRELLINNRLLYMDSKWQGGDFTINKTMSGISFRLSGNKPDATSDKYLENTIFNMEGQEYGKYPVPYFDSVPTFTITPYLDLYLTQFVDEDAYTNTEPYRASRNVGGMETTVSNDIIASYRSGIVDEQLNYLAGSDYLSSIGDMSIRYPSEVHYTQGNRLLDITLGSDIPGYFNDKLTDSSAFELGTGANENEKPLLQKIILTNLRKLKRFIDASNARKLQEFRALNTLITYVTFADGAPLRIVHLPNSTTQLKFVQNKNLTKIIRQKPIILDMVDGVAYYRDSTEYEGLYVEGVTDYEYGIAESGTGSNISIIDFEGDAMGYDSYELLRNVVALKDGTAKRLKIRMADINWTPYTKVENGEERQPGVVYKYLTDHNTYIDYNRTSWDDDTFQERVYTYNPNTNENIISDLSLLDKFIDDYNSSIENGTINQYTNNNENTATQATRPALSGRLHVANKNGEAISESLLTTKYGVWSDLQITADKVIESYICKFIEIDDTGKEKEIETPTRYDSVEYDNKVPDITSKIPSKPNYTFKGWALDKAGLQLAITYDIFTGALTPNYLYRNNKFSSNNTVITYYAIFEIQHFGLKVYDANKQLVVLDEANRQYILNDNGDKEEVTTLVPSGEPIPTLMVPTNEIDPVTNENKKVPLRLTKDDSDLDLTLTYKFNGYSLNQNDTTEVTQALPNTVNKDLSIYATFKTVSVYDEENILMDNTYYDIATYTINNNDYTAIVFKTEANSLTGKITLPSSIDGRQITAFNPKSFDSYTQRIHPNITHIFWANGAQVSLIGPFACQYWTKLKYFELPQSNTIIEQNAFQRTESLFDGISQSQMDLFFKNISIIRTQAFNSMSTSSVRTEGNTCLNGKKINLYNIKQIEDQSFSSTIVPGGMTIGSPESDPDYNRWITGTSSNWQGILNGSSANGGFITSDLMPIQIEYISHLDADYNWNIEYELPNILMPKNTGLVNINIVNV